MKIHAAVPIIIGLALIISAPVVSKAAYAQATMQPSSNAVESGQNTAVKICKPSAFAAPISHISTIQGKIFFVTALHEFHQHHHPH